MLPKLHARQRDRFEIVFVGNDFFRKGGGQLLRAFERSRHTDWHLTIISSFTPDWGRRPSECEAKYWETVIANDSRIDTLSHVSHSTVIDTLKNSDVSVCVTYGDPWPNSIAESFAVGVPVIASDFETAGELVQHDYNGQVVAVGGRPRADVGEDIYAALQRYYDDSSLSDLHGRNARIYAEKYLSVEARNGVLAEALGN